MNLFCRLDLAVLSRQSEVTMRLIGNLKWKLIDCYNWTPKLKFQSIVFDHVFVFLAEIGAELNYKQSLLMWTKASIMTSHTTEFGSFLLKKRKKYILSFSYWFVLWLCCDGEQEDWSVLLLSLFVTVSILLVG